MTFLPLLKKSLFLFMLFWSTHGISQVNPFYEFEGWIASIREHYKANSDSIIDIYTQILRKPEVQNNAYKTSSLYSHIAYQLKYQKKDIAAAQVYYQKAYNLAHAHNICLTEITSLVGIALIYHDLNRMDDKIEALEKAASLVNSCPSGTNNSYVFTQLGLAYLDKKELSRAEKNFLKADSVIISNDSIPFSLCSFNYSCLINFYSAQKNYSRVKEYGHKAIVLSRHKFNNYKNDIVATYTFIANIFKSIGDIDSALVYAHKLQSLPMENYEWKNREFIATANTLLADLYEEKGDLKKAMKYQRLYSSIVDSMYSVNHSESNIIKVKELENELLLQKKQSEIYYHRSINIIIGCLVLLAITIAYIFYKNARKQEQLNKTLEAQKQELTSLNEIRTKMFSVLSHDLRSPIGALKNMIDLYHTKTLSRQDFDSFTHDLKRNLNAIFDTLNTILDWSYAQLRGKKPFIEPLCAYTIVSEQLGLQMETARQKQIRIINNVPQDFTIHADYNQLSLIVRNLINNAIKYTLETGQIEINAEVTEGVKKLNFIDTGVGMTEQEVESILLKNIQSPKSYQGKGFGLQMIHDFLKENNCQLSIKSQKNVGSVFTLIFS